MKKVVDAMMKKKVNRRGKPIVKKPAAKKPTPKKAPPKKVLPKRGSRFA